MKFSNLLITILILFTLSATGWFIWKDTQTASPVSDYQLPVTATSSDLEFKVINLQEEALKIINRPIMAREQFPAEIEADLRRQFNDAYSAIRTNFDFLDSWVSLGQLRKVIGDYEGARDAWEFGSLIRPDNSLTFHNLGDLYGLYFNDIEKAEENYLMSIENDSANIAGYINFAELLWNTGEEKYRDKIPGLLLGGLPDNSGAENRVPLFGRLAKYYSDIGDNQKAIQYYEEILILDTSYEDLIRSEIERLNR